MKSIHETKDIMWHKATLHRIYEIIKSCENLEQLEVAERMLKNYENDFKFEDDKILQLLLDIKEYCSTLKTLL